MMCSAGLEPALPKEQGSQPCASTKFRHEHETMVMSGIEPAILPFQGSEDTMSSPRPSARDGSRTHIGLSPAVSETAAYPFGYTRIERRTGESNSWAVFQTIGFPGRRGSPTTTRSPRHERSRIRTYSARRHGVYSAAQLSHSGVLPQRHECTRSDSNGYTPEDTGFQASDLQHVQMRTARFELAKPVVLSHRGLPVAITSAMNDTTRTKDPYPLKRENPSSLSAGGVLGRIGLWPTTGESPPRWQAARNR